ncbi:MaoC/PaaZ C-terminal domain-containing protein [Nocardia cyriacigeorgica]|uniref:MaoC/PaaZ C-terminal domain-containing protein n=1 Tax=Nocardia cyriacigeorgica TaxID=135487 RepID=UPI0024570B39|nr:MaoC/PaaZ C-terminal domain-containing protein [Nocardia cyriacigeorgica]
MPLNASTVGLTLKPWTTTIDARRLMAYAAGLGHTDDVYFDTTRPTGIVNHPLFPLSPEWDLLTDPDSGMAALGLTLAETHRGVHAGHDLHLHRTIPAGAMVTVTAEITGIRRTSAGALITMRLDGTDGDGPLWTTWMDSLYRDVDVDGADRVIDSGPERPVPPPTAETRSGKVRIETWAPHVYGECGRLWNPIHTDLAIARAAGLPGVILHGSATLAHGLDWVLATLGAGPQRVRRVGAAFRAVVEVPSTIRPTLHTVDIQPDGTSTAHFSVLNEAGHQAVRDAYVVLSS